MSGSRQDWFRNEMGALLARLAPPSTLASDEALRNAEIETLAKAVNRSAPREGWQEWWHEFEYALLASRSTRVWPTVGEIVRLAERERAERAQPVETGRPWRPSAPEINAARMQRGEPVAEKWCQGDGALAMIRHGVPGATLERYRAAHDRMRAARVGGLS